MTVQYFWWALIGILHILVILRVLMREQRSPYSRAAWLILLLALPGVGVALYVLFGEAWFAPASRQRAKRDYQQLQQKFAPHHRHSLQDIPAAYQNAFRTCQNINHFPIGNNDHIHVCADSDAAINDMINDIHAAQKSVHLVFYIWLCDNNGNKMIHAICDAAKRGVQCRIMVDAIGSRDLIHSSQWQQMQHAGAYLCVALQHKIGGNPLHAVRVDLRNHRKMLIIDDKITYCGSQNCADPAFLIKAKYAPWIDIILRFEGEIAQQQQWLFMDNWLDETGEDLAITQSESFETITQSSKYAVAFGTGPLSPEGTMSDAFCSIINSAQQELIISTPYFVPDQALLGAIIASSRRGVVVKLLLPARNDSPFVAAMCRAYYHTLLQAGVQIFEYHGGLLHAKTIVADQNLALIGSANMDRRSLELNFENNVLLFDPATAAAIKQRQQFYLLSCTQYTLADLNKRRFYQIIWQNLLTVFEPIF